MALNLGNLLRRINCLCKRLEDLETVVDGLEGGTELPLFTEGSVLFAAPDGSITEDNTNFFWDNANNRLGIGTNAPDVSLHVAGYVKLRPADIILYGTPPIDFAQTWNAASTITGFSMAITDTLSNSGSLLMDLLVGGTSRFKVRKDGRITTAETIEFTNALTNNTTPTGFLTLSSPTLGRARYSTVVQMQTALGVIGGTALTAGYVAFGNGTGITGESGFFYNTSTNFLGLGNDAPMTKLNVSDTISTSPRGILSSQYSSDTAGARVGFSKARGTVTVPTVIVTGDVIGSLVFRGYDGTFANYVESASIEVVSTGTIAHASGRVPSYMTFSTSTDAAPSVLTERMRINSEGSVSLPSSGLNASLPMLTMTGTWYASGTATTSKPHLLLEPTGTTSTGWSAVGTGIGVNAATGFLGSFIDLQRIGVSYFKVNYRGDVNISRAITYGQAGAAMGSFPITTVNGTPDPAGTNYQFASSTTTQSATAGAFSIFGSTFAHTAASNQYFTLISSSFGAAAGSANYRPFGILYTINNSGVQSGTATGIFLNATETALNSMIHNLMDLQVGGSSKFKVSNTGKITTTNTISLISTGAAATAGTATLVAGTVTVNTTAMTTTAILNYNRKTAGGVIGNITYTQVNGTSFTLTSDNALDTSVIVWNIIETY